MDESLFTVTLKRVPWINTQKLNRKTVIWSQPLCVFVCLWGGVYLKIFSET